MEKKVRPDIDEYFLKIAKVVGERATCVRRKIGAVAVRDKQILTTGYNGAPARTKDCLELGCLRDQMNVPSGMPHDVCRSVHAEQNVIIQAATHGISLAGATVYCTTAPCALCARMLVNARIARYVCFIEYPNKEAEELFKNADIKFDVLPEPTFDPENVGEQVLAVDSDTFNEAGYFIGFKRKDDDLYKRLLSKVRFVDRDDAEVSDAWKQIIPYILIKYNDEYLVIQRLPRSGEKRLHNAYALGVGGHINPKDSGGTSEGSDVIERGMFREMNEEIWLKDLKDINLIGFVYTSDQDVSKHHIGFVYEATLGSKDIEILERDKLRPFFVKREELPKYLDGKELWAKIIYDNYIEKRVSKIKGAK